jgi:aldehyde dehydrogenase (NAD+)
MMTIETDAPVVGLWIGGERRAQGSGGTHDHVNPATGLVGDTIPLAGAAEVDEAVVIADRAFASWRNTPPAQRQALLFTLADLVEANAAKFGELSARENGSPIVVATTVVGKVVEWIRYYAGWPGKIDGQVTSAYGPDGVFSYTLPQPLGVIGAIITWNGPLMSLAMKVPAMLAAGNTVVVKPSELTPYTPELFAELVSQAGFPPGVVQVLPGAAEAGSVLAAHPLVRKVSFTGGPDTARKILHACAENMTPTVLELGGKSANIILDDADLDTACSQGVMMGIGLLSGQGCAFPTRMLAHRAIYDEVIKRAKTLAESIVIGDPMAPQTMSGPVVSRQSFDRILAVIGRAKRDGARLITGGGPLNRPGLDGYYIQPTVFADVDPDSDLAQNEVFGPVLAISPFDTDEQAIEIANNSRYGLSGYVHTKNIRRAHAMAEGIRTGEVLINGALNLAANRPFGGLGISGFGKEGGRDGIYEFLNMKSVAIN